MKNFMAIRYLCDLYEIPLITEYSESLMSSSHGKTRPEIASSRDLMHAGAVCNSAFAEKMLASFNKP
jgi:hypothetical protein